MIVFPEAKINIGLRVVAKRRDGFHDIETLMYPLPLKDILEIILATDEETKLDISGIPIDGKLEDNLCFKAWKILHESFQVPPVEMFLHKIIPHGAGLGGGSSDAAHTLKAINELFAINLSDKQLFEYAEKLGSDCPFFVHAKPSIASGKGNNLASFPVSLQGWYILLVKPPFGVNTALAYSHITPKVPDTSLKEMLLLPVENWKGQICNDFEVPVFQMYPELSEIKQKLYRQGAVYASLSGSGSALFGLFNSQPETRNWPENYFVWSACLP